MTRATGTRRSSKLLTKSLAARLQHQVKEHHEQVDWSQVSALARSPRGIPVPITAADASLEQILAAAPRVQNTLAAQGSTWDGQSDLPMDEATFKQMASEVEPGKADGRRQCGGGNAHRAGSPAKTPPAAAPKNGG